MSNNANENSYMTNARNLTGPSRVNGRRSNHLPDRQQRKEKEPDLFTRENIEWTDYICHFEQVSMWNNWSENEKAAQFTMSLRGLAQRILGDLTHDQLTNYKALVSVLTQRFNTAEHETAYRSEFDYQERQQSTTRAYPGSLRMNIVVEQYINGLGSSEIRPHVQFAHPAF